MNTTEPYVNMTKTVLVVDDSLFMRSLIVNTLSRAGYTIIGEADNGKQAIEMAINLNPYLITLDNMLPDMLGKDVLRILRTEAKIESRIVLISAIGHNDAIQQGLHLGATDYIAKPFTEEVLVNRIEQVSSSPERT